MSPWSRCLSSRFRISRHDDWCESDKMHLEFIVTASRRWSGWTPTVWCPDYRRQDWLGGDGSCQVRCVCARVCVSVCPCVCPCARVCQDYPNIPFLFKSPPTFDDSSLVQPQGCWLPNGKDLFPSLILHILVGILL